MKFRYIFLVFMFMALLTGCEKDPVMEFVRPEVLAHKATVEGTTVTLQLTLSSKATLTRVDLHVEGENGRFKRKVEAAKGKTSFTARLQGLKYNTTYTYIVEAGNCYGMERVAETFRFKTGNRPHVEAPDVETLTPTEVTRRSARIRGRFSTYRSGDERGFFFWSNPEDEKRIAIPAERDYYRVYELRPETKYYFQAYVVREGKMYRGAVIEFSTL